MKLMLDQSPYEFKPGESLCDAVRTLGLCTGKLSTDPLVALIAGRVFTLNYIPVREKDVTPERSTIRKAMAASDGTVRLLRYTDSAGQDAYRRTAQFILFLALYRLWPTARAQMSCTAGSAVLFKVTGATDFSVEALRAEVEGIVAADLPLVRRRISTAEAMAYYLENGMPDKARLLSYRRKATFDIYESGNFADYFYGEMAPSTAYLRTYALLPSREGFMLVLPDRQDPDRPADYTEMPNFTAVYTEGKD